MGSFLPRTTLLVLPFPSWGTPFNAFRFVSSPLGVVNAEHLFQCVQVNFGEVFFSLVAVPTDFLFLQVTASHRGRQHPLNMLQLDEVLRKPCLELIKRLHVLVLSRLQEGHLLCCQLRWQPLQYSTSEVPPESPPPPSHGSPSVHAHRPW